MAEDCLPESLRLIASVLRSGQLGQRDLWVDQIEAAATEIETLEREVIITNTSIGELQEHIRNCGCMK